MSDEDGKKTILVVDDESMVRDLISNFLGKLGYQVVLAENGEQALSKFQELEKIPALVITDIVMPVLDGQGLVDALRREHPELCVLYVSGYANRKLPQEELDKIQTGFLAKPFSLRSFAAAVSKLIKVSENSQPNTAA